MKKITFPTNDQKEAVLELFYSEFDNSTTKISEMTGLSLWNVNKIINNDFKNRKNEQQHKDKVFNGSD